MKPVVYIDVLFIINLSINYILLYTTGKAAKLPTKNIRLFTGAFIGAVYAVVMFFPALRLYYTLIAKLLFSGLIVFVSFPFHNRIGYIKGIIIFYIVSFGFGGGVLALFYLTGSGKALQAIMSNGIIYFNLSLPLLLFLVMVVCLLLNIGQRILYRRNLKNRLISELIIESEGVTVKLNAFLDTGNTLQDPISGLPVIVAEYEAIIPLIPQELRDYFSKTPDEVLGAASINSNSEFNSRLLIIPYNSLGKEKGLLFGFKADKIYFHVPQHMWESGKKPSKTENVFSSNKNETEEFKEIKAVVGIYTKNLSKDKSYNALLNYEIEIGDEYIQHDDTHKNAKSI